MRKKEKQGQELFLDTIKQCESSYERWKFVYENGCSDPTWSDGVNLNLVRNHILMARKRLVEMCETEGYEKPPILLRGIPDKVDTEFMAKADEIRERGKQYLERIESDKEYAEFQDELKRLSPPQKLRSDIQRVLCETRRLKSAVLNDNLIDIRNLLRWEKEFSDNVRKALATAKELPTETFQLTLFETA